MSLNDISALEKKAESGDAEAMLQLAYALNKKEDFDASDAEAILSWTEKAAELGNAQAQFELSDIYKSEDTPDYDLEKSFNWLKQSAQNGYTNAKHNLAVCYLGGTGTTQDDAQAFYWMEQASNEGHIKAKRKMGIFYIEGTGVSMDEEKGLSLLNEAASLGDETAKELLKSYKKRKPGKKGKLIRMAVGFVIGGVIGFLLSKDSGYWHIGLLIGAYFGIGIFSYGFAIKKSKSFWLAAIWHTTKEDYHEKGFGAALFSLIIGLVFAGLWSWIKLCFKLLICPFIAIHQVVTSK
jgi:hypothetical protein